MLFEPKVHLFENSHLKILAQLFCTELKLEFEGSEVTFLSVKSEPICRMGFKENYYKTLDTLKHATGLKGKGLYISEYISPYHRLCISIYPGPYQE